MISQTDIRLEEWTEQLLSRGKFAFSLVELKHAMPSATAISRAATVLVGLAEKIDETDLFQLHVEHTPVSVLQRLGYILERETGRPELADALYNSLLENGVTLFRTPLKTGEPSEGFSSDERWKVIINTVIETDF